MNNKPSGPTVNKFDPSTNFGREDFKTLITPKFYQDFKCIGGACENNCCHHWNVTLDRPTYQKYKKHGDIKVRQIANKRTKSCGQHGIDYRQIKLEDNGNCPFLQPEDGLCYVHKNFGEDWLPPICNIYPREDRLIDGELHNSLSISCPEAARKILLDTSAMSLEQTEVGLNTPLPKFASKLNINDVAFHKKFKQIAYNCILAANSDTVEGRLFNLGVLFRLICQRLNNGEPLLPLLHGFDDLIATGELNKMHDSTAPADKVQAFVLQQLLQEFGFAVGNEVFMQYREQALNVLKQSDAYDSKTDSVVLEGYFDRLCRQGYDSVVDSHGHGFINMMLHWVYSSQFKLSDSEALFAQFATFTLKFFYVRTLCGMLQQGDSEQNAALLVGVVHSISRNADHNRYFLNLVYNSLIEKGLAQPEHILGLIKV